MYERFERIRLRIPVSQYGEETLENVSEKIRPCIQKDKDGRGKEGYPANGFGEGIEPVSTFIRHQW